MINDFCTQTAWPSPLTDEDEKIQQHHHHHHQQQQHFGSYRLSLESNLQNVVIDDEDDDYTDLLSVFESENEKENDEDDNDDDPVHLASIIEAVREVGHGKGGEKKKDDSSSSYEEEDFFGEHHAVEELPEYLKDHHIDQAHLIHDQNTTSQDIERSQFDVHGISKPLDEEDLERVDIGLNELDKEIEKLKEGSGRVSHNYKIAESQCKEFVSSRSFRLMFLRPVSFDAKTAAGNIMAFFDGKRKLWGEEKLGKKITIDDFSEDGLEVLKNGHTQILTTRDDAGRPILFNNLNHLHYTDDGTSQLRVMWYLGMSLFEDEETQKNGFIYISYKIGKEKGNRPSRKLLWEGGLLTRSIPAKCSGIHSCFNRSSLAFKKLMKIALEYHTSQRIRIHEGSDEEIRHTLNCFGIPSSALPVTHDGDVIQKDHLDWIENRRIQEREDAKMEAENLPATKRVMLPTKKDILLGRGKRSQFHPGNLRLNMYLEDRLSEYNKGNRKEKKEIVTNILSEFQLAGSRFLKPCGKDNKGKGGCVWEEVSEEDARQKISHDFRTVRKRATAAAAGVNKRLAESEPFGKATKVTYDGVKGIRKFPTCVPTSFLHNTNFMNQ